MAGLQQLLAFSETAKHGNFAAAAREQGVAPSTLAKAVARLERSLGVKLFHRTTRQVSLTADGERLHARCQRVLAELEDLEAEAAGVSASPSGLLRVDMPIVLGRRMLLPVLAELARRHPRLGLDVRLSDQYVDLVRDGIDVAIRVGALQDSTLVARSWGSMQLVVCAAPSYLKERGTPRRLDDLARHELVAFRQPSSGVDRPWQFKARGEPVQMVPRTRLRCNDGEGAVAMAELGLGLCQVPSELVMDQLADGRLVEVLRTQRPAAMPVSVVMPSGRLVPPRVRAFLDALGTSTSATQDKRPAARAARRRQAPVLSARSRAS